MMKSLWRIVPVCLILALLCWHPSGYAGCTELPPEAQSLSTQDVSSEEEPGDGSHYPKAEGASAPCDDGLPTEGEPADEQLMKRDSVADDEQPAEAQALEDEELAEEVEPEPVNESQPEQLLPEASITQDQGPAPTFDPSPPPSDPASPTAQDSCPDTVSEQVEADMPVLDLSDADVNSAECDLSSVPVVLENTSNVHCGGTKSHVDPAQGTPGLGQGNTSHMLEEQGLSSHVSAEMDPNAATKDPEDIPTFDEWKRKVMEVEKEKTQASHSSSNRASHIVKKPQKNFNNYASVECGAKILGANPEAKSTSAILMENMDLYMLNPCSNKIWFIIELCEPIQLKQLDIANFELFSSTPKDFLVSISDRYPTNKWLKLGTFHGLDERTVQSFPLDELLYAKYVKMFTKYIKVELLSHFGSEHFCPFSLIRVFGTSMVEEYEEIADPSERVDDQDEDFDYPPGHVPLEAKSSHNLIGSAKDVILNMVNNIAVSWGGPDNGNFTGQVLNMTETSASSQLDPTATLTPALETVEEGDQPHIQEDPVASLTEAPAPEPPTPEAPPSEAPQPELPPAEDQVVTPLEEAEEDYPPVVLLDGEEGEEEEERERVEQESLDYGGRPSSPSSSSSSSRCCSASLQEYLQQRCSALPAARTNHGQGEEEEEEGGPEIPPHTHTPAWEEPSAPSVSPAPQERDPPAVSPAPQERDPPAVVPGDREEAGPEPPQLESSQTSSSALPRPSSSDPPASGPGHTPTPDPQALPERSQEAQAEGEEGLLTPTPTTTIIISSTAPVDQVWEPPIEEQPRPEADLPEPHAPAPAHPAEVAVPPQPPFPTAPPATEQAAPPAEPDSGAGTPEESLSNSEVTDPLKGHAVSTETKEEELVDDLLLTSTNGNGQLLRPSSSSPHAPSPSDFYAEQHNASEQASANGNQVHGSSQKESVFMRLNNRIKALEMNMSLSGRYLEQLSQRYRKQMEEMQRAFNKTIIKLQNTSRIAEEQDQRQTESIQMLHGQLKNITELVLNLSVRVIQLQTEVSDRQSYLLLSLVLGLVLGLLLCAQYCRMSALPPSSPDPEPPAPNSYSCCFPDRAFSPYDEPSMKRSASYPLLNSDPLQLPATEGPESLHTVQPLRLNRKKKRGRTKPKENVETLKSSAVVSAPPLANGAPLSNGAPRGMDPGPPLKDSPSEGSSEGSSHSDEPSFCGIATCTRLCDGLPPARGRAGKRASRRRRSKTAACVMADLTQAHPRMSDAAPVPVLLDRWGEELSAGTLGGKALSGHV